MARKKKQPKIDCSGWSMRKFNRWMNKILGKTRKKVGGKK